MKVADYVIKFRDMELMEFMDNIQIILNNGLYEFRVVTTYPTWTAQQGESAIYYVSGGTGLSPHRLYFFIENTWQFIGWTATGAGMSLSDADGDTGITPEYTPDEDVIRFYCHNTYSFGMSTAGLTFDAGTTPLTKIACLTGVYSTTEKTLQLWSAGSVRMEC